MSDQRKTVLITGTSSGIGKALSRELLSKGFRVFATARQTSSIIDLSSEGIETLALEVDKPESIAELKSRIQELTGGKLDMLINNAGRNYTVPAMDVEFDEVQQTFEVNVFSVMRMCQAFVPFLIEAQGTIVQIGSVAAIMPYVFGATYNASKAALHQYSNTLRVELAPFGVKVVTIVTGGVQSSIARTKRELPEGSLYIPITEEYRRRVTHSQDGAMPNEAYAKSVVRQVLVKHPARYVWEGNKSWTVWFISTFIGKRAMDYIFYRMFNLYKLTKRYAVSSRKN